MYYANIMNISFVLRRDVAAKLRPLADKPRAAKPAHWLISPASLIL